MRANGRLDFDRGTDQKLSIMRVIAGKFRSRVLKGLRGQALRPTSDQLRETLFNVLGETVRGARFVDVFAGTGAVGIEALSRGAVEVVFIEKHRAAVALIRRNLESLGVRAGAKVLAMDAQRGLEQLGARGRQEGFQFVFVDPPYAQDEDYDDALRVLSSQPVLATNGIVIVEHHHKKNFPERVGSLARVRVLRQGDAALTFYRREERPTQQDGPAAKQQ